MICSCTTFYWETPSTLRTHRQTSYMYTYSCLLACRNKNVSPIQNHPSFPLCPGSIGSILSCLLKPSMLTELLLLHSIAHLSGSFPLSLIKPFVFTKRKIIIRNPQLRMFFSPGIVPSPFPTLQKSISLQSCLNFPSTSLYLPSTFNPPHYGFPFYLSTKICFCMTATFLTLKMVLAS